MVHSGNLQQPQMTLDGRPITLDELNKKKQNLQEAASQGNEPPKRIVEVAPNVFQTKTVLQG